MLANDLPELLAAEPIVVLHFWAPWNGVDRMMDELLQDLIPQFAGRITFRAVLVDVESNWPLARECHILNIPALTCFVRGQHHETLHGMRQRDEMRRLLETWAAA